MSTEFRAGVLNKADPISRKVSPLDLGFLHQNNSFTRDNVPPLLKGSSALLDPSIDCMEESILFENREF